MGPTTPDGGPRHPGRPDGEGPAPATPGGGPGRDRPGDEQPGPLFGWNPGHLRQVKLGDLGIRFAFGAAVSVLAGLITLALGSHAGGLLLAFPAILPATLTLLQKEDSTATAVTDVRGAVPGAVALGGFAVTANATLTSAGPLGLLLALLAWIVIAVGLYLADEALRRRRRGRHHGGSIPSGPPVG